MAKAIIMPKLDMTMEEGEISSWLVKEGDVVKKGEPLFEVLSEKAAIEVESTAKGTVLKILHGEGEVIAITDTVAIVGKPGEDISALLVGDTETEKVDVVVEAEVEAEATSQVAFVSSNGQVPSTPAAKELARTEAIDITQVTPNVEGKIRKQQVEDYIAESKKVKATPLAAKIASENNVDLNSINIDKSRIYSDDVLEKIGGSSATVVEDAAVEGVKLKGIKKISAQRLTQVWQTVPMVTNTVEVDVSKVTELCKRLNENIGPEDIKVNITDMLIKVMATALDRNPETNVSLQGDFLITNKSVNISMAVSTDNGLTVPVLKDVNKMSLRDINVLKRALAVKAQEGSLKTTDMQGGSMTISNIGMFGVDIFTPLINMPESSILGIGRITKKPVVVDDEIVIRPMMWLSHTFDHRALDGVPAMKLLGCIRDMIENPDLLIY